MIVAIELSIIEIITIIAAIIMLVEIRGKLDLFLPIKPKKRA